MTLTRPIGIEHAGHVAVITEKRKITADGREPWRLFDLSTDRFERRDLAAEHPDNVEQLWQPPRERTEIPSTAWPIGMTVMIGAFA